MVEESLNVVTRECACLARAAHAGGSATTHGAGGFGDGFLLEVVDALLLLGEEEGEEEPRVLELGEGVLRKGRVRRGAGEGKRWHQGRG